MSEQLTLQTYADGQWHDALVLTVENPEKVLLGATSAGYDTNYLVTFIELMDSVIRILRSRAP